MLYQLLSSCCDKTAWPKAEQQVKGPHLQLHSRSSAQAGSGEILRSSPSNCPFSRNAVPPNSVIIFPNSFTKWGSNTQIPVIPWGDSSHQNHHRCLMVKLGGGAGEVSLILLPWELKLDIKYFFPFTPPFPPPVSGRWTWDVSFGRQRPTSASCKQETMLVSVWRQLLWCLPLCSFVIMRWNSLVQWRPFA